MDQSDNLTDDERLVLQYLLSKKGPNTKKDQESYHSCLFYVVAFCIVTAFWIAAIAS